MYQNTITLFNYHEQSGIWYPSVISGVDLIALNSSTTTVNGHRSDDTVEVLINCSAGQMVNTSAGEKMYLRPKDFARYSAPQIAITFKAECDFIYDGVYPDLTPIQDSQMESGLYHHMNEQYDGVYMVTSAVFYSLIPHFEIGGR